ncbi:MAG: response regulator [Candidatus Saganbacteria bacterium]|nr:response regulator [Candidatus Saganbacteria bacterium]
MKNILIVEDVEDHLEIVKIILEQYNYNILTAANGRSGLETVQKKLPDLIILDVMLPEMNGYEVCKAIRADQHTRVIPVIMLSVKSNPEDIEAGYKAGANEYITKPFNLEELVKKVKKHLGEE